MTTAHHAPQPSHVPSIRIWLCGPLQIEWIDPTTGQASVLTEQAIRRSTTDATQVLSLLKMLLCQPGRQAHRDWVLEQFWPEHTQSAAVHRFHNIISAFRKVLCPPDGISLLPPITGKKDSSSHYTLPAYPRLWVDGDAALWNVEQAVRMHRFGEDAFPFWQRAYELLKRGPFLADEPYAEWAQARREPLESCYRQCVHALWCLSVERHGEAGKAEALLLLRTYWQQHKTDEDALRPLMELLGEQERYQEAEEYYTQLLHALAELDEEDGRTPREPDERTRDVRVYLQTKPIQRRPMRAFTGSIAEISHSTLARPSNQHVMTPNADLAPIIAQDIMSIMEVVNQPEKITHQSGTQDMEPSRRNLLKQTIPFLFGVSDALLSVSFDAEAEERLLQPLLDSSSFDDKTITKFEKITANCWLLLRVDGLPAVEQLLPTYLPRFASFSRRPSKYQQRAASIAAQGYILQGLVAVLNSNPVESERFCEQAVFYARLAKDRNLEAAALKHLATKFLDNGYPLRALQTYQEVLPFIKEVSPLLQGRTYLGLSLTYARTNQENKALHYLDQAYASFPDNPESDFSFPYADCHLSSLHHYAGLILAEFGRFEKARTIFAQVKELSTRYTIPERTRIEIMNCQAEVSLALRDLKSSRDLIEKSVAGALHLKSEKRYNDALALYKQARLLFPQESQVRELADLFIR